MTNVLNVTYHDVYTGKRAWIGYTVKAGFSVAAVVFDSGGLDDLRDWADNNGYDGILLGSPTVPFRQAVGFVPIFKDEPDSTD